MRLPIAGGFRHTPISLEFSEPFVGHDCADAQSHEVRPAQGGREPVLALARRNGIDGFPARNETDAAPPRTGATLYQLALRASPDIMGATTEDGPREPVSKR